ncbi:MAG: formylglycine-generating enzyme family protein [Gloeobacteraceae cyanobacterium ES-bin-144]|nr:formylglycine-generating enzyme family protein [Verrucomicrobiales bacterium]
MKVIRTAFAHGLNDRYDMLKLGFPRYGVLVCAMIFCMTLIGCKSSWFLSDPMEGSKAGEVRSFGIAQGADIDFRWIPAGEFMMGSPSDELGRDNEETQNSVHIKEGFWMAEHETTVLTWLKIMDHQSSKTINVGNVAKKPVVYISWYDCQEFLRRLKPPEPGWKYELPCEEQWEYACRAGSTSAYARSAAELGWIAANSGGHCHAVGTKTSNAWGLYDMHGNVAEWCRNLADSSKSEIAIRGGSWDSDFNSRAAAKNSDTPLLRINSVGFRLVLVREKSLTTPTAPTAFQITQSHMP